MYCWLRDCSLYTVFGPRKSWTSLVGQYLGHWIEGVRFIGLSFIWTMFIILIAFVVTFFTTLNVDYSCCCCFYHRRRNNITSYPPPPQTRRRSYLFSRCLSRRYANYEVVLFWNTATVKNAKYEVLSIRCLVYSRIVSRMCRMAEF